MLEENIWSHYSSWWAVLFFVGFYALLLLFLPFYKKSTYKPRGTYFAFILAFAIEMHGIPFSMYLISWLFGYTLPEGVFWGHTLQNYIGIWGMYINIILFIVGFSLIIVGWRNIYKNYWSKDKGKGQLVTSGIYAYIRHPQYTGLFLITLGMMCEWATIPLILMWPVLLYMYYRLAKREEQDMEKEFGEEYLLYKERTNMFFPLPKRLSKSYS